MSFHWNGEAIAQEIRRRANMGLKASAIHLTNRIKEELSVPAPRVRLYDKTGATYYRAGWLKFAATARLARVTSYKMVNGRLEPRLVIFEPSPATPGALPRKLSGRLRGSITYEVDEAGMVARVGTNVIYARAHEGGDHKFMMATLRKFQAEVATILGRTNFEADTVYPAKAS